MDYHTYHDITKINKIGTSTLIFTNKTGITCKQALIEDRIRMKIFRNKTLCAFIEIFENIIIKKHLKAIWFSYNRKYLTKIFVSLCYYFNKLPQQLLLQNIQVFCTEQLNYEAIEKIIQHTYNIQNVNIWLCNKKYVVSRSEYFLGINFIIGKTNIGYNKYDNKSIVINITCEENEYHNFLFKQKHNSEIIKQYTVNLKIKITITTIINRNYGIGKTYIGCNFFTTKITNKKVVQILQ